MSNEPESADASQSQIGGVLKEYFERVDRGEAVDVESFLAEHAPIAGALRPLIQTDEELARMAGRRREVGDHHASAEISTHSLANRLDETRPPPAKGSRPADRGELPARLGRYRIVRALGRGAMGIVYLADDTQLNRQVALKMPRFADDANGESLLRFYREAQAAAMLRHPNICPVYDVGQIDGEHYISMAYIEGRPLSDFVQTADPQSERQILIAVRKLALALQDAHEHGIVHRDLKPANVIIDRRGEPIIMDFGLARQLHRESDARITQSGVLIGSPAYMSPEQIDGEPDAVGPLSDQYSLGVILYELLTGQLPFRGSLVAVMGQIISKEPTPPHALRADLDLRIEDACAKMMAKKAAARFTSLSAAADELADILRSPDQRRTPQRQVDTRPFAGRQPPAAAEPAPSTSAGAAPAAPETQTPTHKDLELIEELARKRFARRDFDQVIQIVDGVPEALRGAGLVELLNQSRARTDEIAYLVCEIDEAVRLNDRATALRKCAELLQIKPRHRRARQVQAQFGDGRSAGGARLDSLRRIARPWREGGLIPWVALAFGLAVFGLMTAVMIVYLRGTAVVIRIDDPDVEVAVKGKAISVTGPGEQRVSVEPGDQQLTITHAGLETTSKSFALKRGQRRIVTVSIVNARLVARLDDQDLPLDLSPASTAEIGSANTGPLDKKAATERTASKGSADKKPAPSSAAPARIASAHGQTQLAAVAPDSPPVVLQSPFDAATARLGQERWAARLRAPVEQTNGVGMMLRLIPPGEFRMGFTPEQVAMLLQRVPVARRANYGKPEQPQHRVLIGRPFYLAAHEVTRRQFAQFVQKTGYKTDAEKSQQGGTGLKAGGNFERGAQYNWMNPSFPQGDRHPVVNVSWKDATAFCEWLSRSEDKTYRLPTEAEWEYACRAGTTTLFSVGDDLNKAVTAGNVMDATWLVKYPGDLIITVRDGYVYTAPVGSFAANAFGLFDMHGNVWEWCRDWFGRSYYGHSPEIDPTGPASGGSRVLRGGAMECPARLCASAVRDGAQTWECSAHIGFRVVCEIADTVAKPDRELLWKLDSHTAVINDLAISPDSRQLASCSRDGTARIWDLAGGRPIHKIDGSFGAAAYLPNGEGLLLGEDQGNRNTTIMLYRTSDWTVVRAMTPCKGPVGRLAVNPTGTRAISSHPKGAFVWNLATGARMRQLDSAKDQPSAGVGAVAFSADGKYAFGAGGKGECFHWEVETGRLVATFRRPACDWDACDARGRIALCGDWGGGAKLFDWEKGTTQLEVGGYDQGGSTRGVALSTDARLALYGADDCFVHVFDAATGQPLHTFGPHADAVRRIVCSPDGKLAATACGDIYVNKGLRPCKDFSVRVWRFPLPTPKTHGTGTP